MPVQVYRCSHCHREVLVRAPGPMSDAEVQRRIEEELRPWSRGPTGRLDMSSRLRDDIWVGLSSMRDADIPRNGVPTSCPACGRDGTLAESRVIDG